MILSAMASIVEASLSGGSVTPPTTSLWGSLDPNYYRGSTPVERIRATDDVANTITGTVLTYSAGTHTWASIRSAINAVPLTTDVTVIFEAGEHEFEDEFYIQRGNITITGGGLDNTIIRYTSPKSGIDVFFSVISGSVSRSSGPSYGTFSSGGSVAGSNTLISATISNEFTKGDKSITLSSVSGLTVGDDILLYKALSGSYTEFSNINQIEAIDGTTLTLRYPIGFSSSQLNAAESLSDIKIYKVTLLRNVTIKDMTFQTAIDPTALNNYEAEDEADLLHCRQNWWVNYAAGADNTNPAERVGFTLLTYGHHRCAVFGGLFEPNIYNIKFDGVGSTGFYVAMVVGGYFDNITVDTTYNKGHGGNGYGVEYYQTYYSDFTNLSFVACRHGVTAQQRGSSSYNNFHILYTEVNSDFHGGRDQCNIIYVEEMVMNSLWEMVAKNGYQSSYEIDKNLGRVSFSAFSYRLDRVNGQKYNRDENLVVFKNAQCFGYGATLYPAESYIYKDADGNKLAASNTGHYDYIVCHPDGGVIYAGFGNNTVVGGAGDDDVYLGYKFYNSNGTINNTASRKEFWVKSGGGNDVVHEFHQTYDKISLESNLNGSGITSEALALAACSNSGSDVVINVGGGNSVTLVGQQVSNLTSANFAII